jgi:uncharacterized protein involved in exopolysaccharide biosynthesis
MSILVQEVANNPVVQDLAVQFKLKDRMDGLSVLLQSRHILLDVIDSLQLVRKDASDAERELKVQELAKSLSARLIGNDLIELKMRSREPAQLSQILEASAIHFIDAIRAPGQSEIASSEVFLQDKIKEQKSAVENAETALANYRNTHSDQLPELHLANATRLEQLKDALQQKKTELAGAEATGQTLRASLAAANPIIGKIEEQIVQVSGELALLRAKYTDEHSAVQGALRQLERLQEERSRQIEAAQTLSTEDLQQLWNRAASMPNVAAAPDPAAGAPAAAASPGGGQPLLISQLSQLQAAEAKVNGLKREIGSLSDDIEALQKKNDAFGDVEQMMTTLERDAKTQRDLYDSLLKRYETARLTVDLGHFELPEAIKVIEQPGVPVSVNLPLPLYFLAGLVAAAALGGAMAFIAELLDSSIRGVGQLERLVKAPVLSTIPMLLADGFTVQGSLDLDLGSSQPPRGAVA